MSSSSSVSLTYYHLYGTDDTNGLTFWKYLDPAASAASIKAGGRAVG